MFVLCCFCTCSRHSARLCCSFKDFFESVQLDRPSFVSGPFAKNLAQASHLHQFTKTLFATLLVPSLIKKVVSARFTRSQLVTVIMATIESTDELSRLVEDNPIAEHRATFGKSPDFETGITFGVTRRTMGLILSSWCTAVCCPQSLLAYYPYVLPLMLIRFRG